MPESFDYQPPALCVEATSFQDIRLSEESSAIFGHSKGKLLTRLTSASHLDHHIHILQQPEATKDEVCIAGLALMVALYSGQPADTLGNMRYKAYSKMVVAKGGSFVADRLSPIVH